MRKQDVKHLNPIRFAKESLSFMEGYSKLKTWLYMPIAYLKYCYYMITGK